MIAAGRGAVPATRIGGTRAAPPDVRLDLLGALAAGALAAAAYLAALLGAVPPAGFSVVLLASAPLLAALALPVYAVRARAEADLPLAWFATGLAVALVAMVLQLVAFPSLSDGGGPLRTGPTGSAHLYLLAHVALPVGALAGALRLPARRRRWCSAAGGALALAAALDALPSPVLIRADGSFTPPLLVTEAVLAAGTAVAVVGWVARVGRVAGPLRGWAAVALSLCGYDVVLNAVAAERFGPVWWASLSLRVGTFAVLAAGGTGSTLAQLSRLERYTDTELDRSDERLNRSLRVTDRLLDSAEALSRAVTASDVRAVVAAAACEATGLPRARVLVAEGGMADGGVVEGGVVEGGVAEGGAGEGGAGGDLPWEAALRRGSPAWWSTRADLLADHPLLAGDPDDGDSACLAALPLLAAGSVVGVLVVGGPGEHAWTAADRELLGGLAAQAAPVLQRALLFERERSAAEVLQRGLLPQRLAEVPGVATAARYLPGAAGSQIGGDWYDCLPLPGGRVALVVGDVMGKGLAAAARMGQVRHAVRVLASIDPSPSAVLASLDALPDEVADDGIVTLVYVLLDPATGVARLGRAGHLPPVLVRPDGRADFVSAGGSPPLGVPRAARHEVSVRVPPGGTLVLFTDGLVEDRRTGLEVGLPRLLDACSRIAGRPDVDVARIADEVLAAVPHAPERPDDTCLLVVRTAERDGREPDRRLLAEVHLPGDLAAPGAVRARLAAVLEGVPGGPAPDEQDTLALLCSELVTNAVVRSGGPVRVRLWLGERRARLEVRDRTAVPPERGPVRALTEPGRGVVLVSALADDWGVELDGEDGDGEGGEGSEGSDGDGRGAGVGDGDGRGTTVWAELGLRGRGGGH